MFTFFIAPENVFFSVSLTIMLLIFLIELVSVSLGAGLSGLIDSMLPDFDLDIDLDTPEVDVTTLTKLLTWFRVGEVPVLILLILFLTAFGLVGLGLQFLAQAVAGMLLPAGIAAIAAFFAALPVVRWGAGLLARYMPGDETYVSSERDFLGKVATVIVGEARAGAPAQAKMKDAYGQSQYIIIEPDLPDEVFRKGDPVILVKKQGAVYKAIRTPAALNKEQE